MYGLNRKYQNLLFVVILRWARSRNRIFVMHLANMSPAIVLCGKLFWANWTSWSNNNNGSIGTDIWLIHWGVKDRFGFYFWNNFNRKVHFDQWWTLIGQRIWLNRGRIILPLEKEACQGKFPKIIDFGNLSESNDTYFERFLQLACSSTSQICPIKCQSTLNISMTHFFMLNKLWKLPRRIQNKSWNSTVLLAPPKHCDRDCFALQQSARPGYELFWIFLKSVRQFLHSKITSVYCNKSAFPMIKFKPSHVSSLQKWGAFPDGHFARIPYEAA